MADNPFELLGGEAAVRSIVRDFYRVMARDEPRLAKMHACEPDGTVTAEAQERFALFLVGWTGGPQTYMERHGHPRLRMRHAGVPVDTGLRDAWLRCMTAALDENRVEGPVRAFLETRFAEVADFLRNTPG